MKQRKFMQHTAVSRTPFFSLIGNLRDEIKALFREEIKLAKAELGQKGAKFGKNAVFLAIGGFIAYTGLILLLAGLGVLAAYGFEQAGLSRLMAVFLGLGAVGVLIAGLGTAFVFKALAGFKTEPLAPEKTIDTLKHMREPDPAAEYAKIHEKLEPKRSPDEIKSHIDSTQGLMKETARELKHRLTPAYMGKAFAAGVRHHPLRAGLIGAASGLVGFLVVKHRQHHNGHNGRH